MIEKRCSDTREAFHRLLVVLSHQDQEPVFLFVQDLQNVDDVFNIAWFWAKDPKGLEPLSQLDMLSLGLREPCLSKISANGYHEEATCFP